MNDQIPFIKINFLISGHIFQPIPDPSIKKTVPETEHSLPQAQPQLPYLGQGITGRCLLLSAPCCFTLAFLKGTERQLLLVVVAKVAHNAAGGVGVDGGDGGLIPFLIHGVACPAVVSRVPLSTMASSTVNNGILQSLFSEGRVAFKIHTIFQHSWWYVVNAGALFTF